MSNPTTKTALRLITTDDGSDLDAIDPRTKMERYCDMGLCYVIGHTQVWQWDGGDAICLVTNKIGEPCAGATVIRVGDKVCVFHSLSGLTQAMECMGLDSKSFQVQ